MNVFRPIKIVLTFVFVVTFGVAAELAMLSDGEIVLCIGLVLVLISLQLEPE